MDGGIVALARVPTWSPVRYRGISPRPTALRVAGTMWAPSLRRLGGCHPLTLAITSIASRWEASVFRLREMAEAARNGDVRWPEDRADRILTRLRHLREAHSSAVRLARQMAERAR